MLVMGDALAMAILQARGFKQQDVENIMHENFLRFLRNAWKS